MTFEKAAAFAFTDIDLSGNLFEQDFFLIMVVQVGEQHQQTFPVTLYRRKRFGLWLSILIQDQPDPGEQDLNLKIPARSLGRRNFPDFCQVCKDFCLPCDIRGKFDGRKTVVQCQRCDIGCLNAAGFEAINDTWVKGRGNINTVFLIIHVSGVRHVGIAEKSLAGGEMISFVIYLIIDVSGYDQSQLNLRMPVPEKGTSLIRKQVFMAYIYRKSKRSVVF